MILSKALALVLLATLLPVESVSTKRPATSPVRVDETKALQPEAKSRPQKVFLIMHEKLNWFKAKKFCEESGMNLATIRNKEEQKALEQLIKKRGIENEDLWLGGHDLLQGGKEEWTWRVGYLDEPFTYSNWDDGEPNNFEGTQHCLQLRTKYNYGWDDTYCSNVLRVICENKFCVN